MLLVKSLIKIMNFCNIVGSIPITAVIPPGAFTIKLYGHNLRIFVIT
jgi:hypothetical protein